MAKPDLSSVECNSCNRAGGLHITKRSRFSTVVVIIGWLFVLPSLLGIGCGTLGLVSTGSAASQTTENMLAAYAKSVGKVEGLSPAQIAKVGDQPSMTKDEMSNLGLSKRQIEEVERAQSSYTAGAVGAGAGAGLMGGASVAVIIGSLIGGLLGYLLIMKRKLIVCRTCQAVHSEAA